MAVRHDQLREEQHAVDVRYERLDELRTQTAERLREVRRVGPSGSPQNRSERDAFATLYEDRLAQLDAVEQRLVFGRLDLVDGSVRYVGRIGLTDAEHTSLLTDWRAPAAQAFYRATAARPDDVVRRRHLVTRGREVTAIEDDVLDLAALDEAGGTALSGGGALLAALSARRTGRMGDIVATIQAEQDTVIRAPLDGALVVQGGPGTGKTAVALHRAAYLLYAHRRQLERSGVLILGPSRVFLRYIDQVLPSLGETGVVTATLGELLPGVSATRHDRAEVAELKGRALMARVVARAVRQRQRVPVEPVDVVVEGRRLQITRRDVREAIARARRTGRPHNQARVTFVREMLQRLADQYVALLGYAVPPEDRGEILEELRTTRDVRVTLNLAWLPLTPQRLVGDLLTKPARLEAAAPELDDRERALLLRDRDDPWTVDDVPLLDEAAELLGEDDQASRAQAAADARRRESEVQYARDVLRSSGAGALVSAEMLAERFAESGPRLTTAERAAQDRTWTYGHVVVDEAQELSPMAWRAVLRRVPTRSLTIVGDVAQTAAPGGARDWATALDPVLGRSWRLAELTVNYRTPATVAEAAARVARAAGVPVTTVRSARDVEDALRVERVPADSVLDTVVAAARAELDRWTDTEAGGEVLGRVAVVAPDGHVPDVVAALERALGPDLLAGPSGDATLTVLTPRESKGLEFDAVVLVEPARVLETSAGDLYVAMTRPTQSLHVVTSLPLPAGFADDAAPDAAGP